MSADLRADLGTDVRERARVATIGMRVGMLLLELALAGLCLATSGQARAADEREEPAPEVAEELIVTGSRLTGEPFERPFPSTVITGEQLDNGISPTVLDALRFVPGLNLVQDGSPGGRAQLSLRGLDPNHVVVLVDGVRLNDPTNSRGGSFDPTTLALVDIERIEIVRGPLSSIHGADALAGVIQIVTRGVEPDDGLRTRVRSRIGRYHVADVAGQASAGIGGIAGLSLGAAFDSSRDPHSDGGFDGGSLHAKLRVPLPFEVDFETFTRIHESSARSFPESSGGPELATLRAMEDRDVREISFGASWMRAFQNDRSHLRLIASRASRREDLESPGIGPGIVPRSRAGDEYERWDLSLVGDGQLPALGLPGFSEGVKLVSGLAQLWENGESDTYLDFPVVGFQPVPFFDTRRTFSVFSELEQPIGALVVVSGSVRFDSTPDEDDRTSPSVGIVSTIPRTPFSIFGRYGQGFRRPSFYALSNPIVGNSSLGFERSQGWEVGVRYGEPGDRVSAQIGYFDLEVESLHDFDAELFQIVARGRLVSRGAEVELHLRPTQWLGIDGAMSFNPTDFGGTSSPPLNRPRWRGFVELHARPWADWDFMLRALVVGASKGTAAGLDFGSKTITLAGYERIDARVAWTALEGFDVFLEIENLTNRTRRESVGFESPGIAPRVGIALYR